MITIIFYCSPFPPSPNPLTRVINHAITHVGPYNGHDPWCVIEFDYTYILHVLHQMQMCFSQKLSALFRPYMRTHHRNSFKWAVIDHWNRVSDRVASLSITALLTVLPDYYLGFFIPGTSHRYQRVLARYRLINDRTRY